MAQFNFIVCYFLSNSQVKILPAAERTSDRRKGNGIKESPPGSNADVDFQIQYLGGKQVRRKQIFIFVLQTFLCMQNCTAGGSKTDTVGVNPQK